jgi:hypothetical protein
MPTPPDREQPHEGPPLEPIRVLRPRRTDALAELVREYREQSGRYDAVALPTAPPHAEDVTQELPPVLDDRRPAPGEAPRGRPRGLRRIAVAGAVAAAAVVGFGCAFLLPGRSDATAAPALSLRPRPPQPSPPRPPRPAWPIPTAPAPSGKEPEAPR